MAPIRHRLPRLGRAGRVRRVRRVRQPGHEQLVGLVQLVQLVHHGPRSTADHHPNHRHHGHLREPDRWDRLDHRRHNQRSRQFHRRSPPPSCGDGHLDPGEQCDLGLVENSDTGACSLACKLPTCGDGLVWAGKEACDHGPANNDVLYAGCTTQCQFGPMCGDGALQGPEECDLGPSNGTGESPPTGVPCDSGCRFQARLVFLSSAVYKGGELGGVEGAHIRCQILAKQAKFDNATKFMAWISDAQHSPFQNFNHGPNTAGVPYVLPNGTRVANDWDDLILNGAGDGITVTETGETLLSKGVWTGTAPSGKPFDPLATCQSWSSSSATDKSRVGLDGVDKQQAASWMQWKDGKHWTNHTSFGCDLTYRVYCFEQ